MNAANVVNSTRPRTRRQGPNLQLKNLTQSELIADCYDLESCIEPVTLVPILISLQQKITAIEKQYRELQELNIRISDELNVNKSAMISLRKNEKAIQQFFAMNGAETCKRVSAFLFEMMALYIASPNNYEL